MANNTLTITDNRTGQTIEVPIEHDTINAMALRQLKVTPDDFGLMLYDPAYKNTASCRSSITYIDGDAGILEYRGYPIEQLAEKARFLEVVYLLLNGELPNQTQLEAWEEDVRYHTLIHENFVRLLSAFRYDAHPMGMFISGVSALSTFYPGARKIADPVNRHLQITRLIAKVPTLAAMIYRHMNGFPVNRPNNQLDFSGNFLNMMFRMVEPEYVPHPALQKAIDVLFILHADHEQNCSTATMRNIGSAQTDPYSAVAGAAAALYGPLHGGANEAVLRMLEEISDVKNIPVYIERVKNREVRLMGFGHRVYRNYDPRARIIRETAHEVFKVTGQNKLLDIALELEKIALEDDYFVERKLYPNVDFYSGIIYQSMGLPPSFFTVMFAIARTAGWLAQWEELVNDPEQAIARPRQVYLGHRQREFVPIDKRA